MSFTPASRVLGQARPHCGAAAPPALQRSCTVCTAMQPVFRQRAPAEYAGRHAGRPGLQRGASAERQIEDTRVPLNALVGPTEKGYSTPFYQFFTV